MITISHVCKLFGAQPIQQRRCSVGARDRQLLPMHRRPQVSKRQLEKDVARMQTVTVSPYVPPILA
jgi:hypothetical protein